MGSSAVLIPPAPVGSAPEGLPRYSLKLSTDSDEIEAVQRLRAEVFANEPGFAGAADSFVDGKDADAYDEHCEHLLVWEENAQEVVGCYRLLPPPAAIVMGGLYTAGEFELSSLDSLRPQTVEVGRACVRAEHRCGSVLALMWAGILAYLDRTGYEYLVGCVSVPIQEDPADIPGSHVRGIRDEVLVKNASEYRVYPHRPVVLDGAALDDIPAPAKVKSPPLIRGYQRIGAKFCGEPAHDPVFGVADFAVLLALKDANRRYLDRLRSAAQVAESRSAATSPSERSRQR